MNEWAKHYGGGGVDAGGFDRRVSTREFCEALGVGRTWFLRLIAEGRVPRPMRDPGGRRNWWRASTVAATLEQFARDAA